MSRFILSAPIIRFVMFIERWLISAVFLFLAYEYVSMIQLMELVRHSRAIVPAGMVARDAALAYGIHFQDYAHYGLLAVSNFVSGILLLISRKPSQTPTSAKEVVIPLAATFSYMVYNLNVPLPAFLTMPLAPHGWAPALAILGLAVSTAGAVISMGSVMWLGRSMGVVVSVREVVTGGPYRFVRHPVYFGYLFVLAGLMLTSCTLRMLILVVASLAMLIWRARIEERLLCAHSPAYCEWRKVTGFLWPRWNSRTTREILSTRGLAGEIVAPAPAAR
jgi:protein-S-isoprenylcysteine O-methyltransferase Ste14